MRFALFFTARTNAVPGRFSAGPCGMAMKFRNFAAPVWNLTSSIRPNISGDNSPPANERKKVRVVGMFIFLLTRERCVPP